MTVYCRKCAAPVPEPGLWLSPSGDVCSQDCAYFYASIWRRPMVEVVEDHVCDDECVNVNADGGHAAYVWTAGTPALGMAS